MKRNRFLHIFRLLHFTDNNNKPDMTEENSVKLWKMRILFEIIKRLSKLLQPFWISGCRRSYCFVQRKGHFPKIHNQETQKFWHQNLRNMWPDCLHVRHDSLFFTCRNQQNSTKVRISGQWRWRNQNVVCELRTVWSEKFLVKCSGSMTCVCAVRWCFWHSHAKVKLQNFEALISYASLGSETVM